MCPDDRKPKDGERRERFDESIAFGKTGRRKKSTDQQGDKSDDKKSGK